MPAPKTKRPAAPAPTPIGEVAEDAPFAVERSQGGPDLGEIIAIDAEQKQIRLPTEAEGARIKSGSAPVSLRMDRILMEYPFFSIRDTPVYAKQKFQIGEAEIVITPGGDGQATYWDLDILRFAISELNRQVEAKETTGPTVIFVAHQFLKMAKRSTGADGYKALVGSLRRLAGTRIETNIMSGGQRRVTGFAWIEKYDLVGEDDGQGGIKRLQGISVTLSSWLYDAIVEDKRVLSFTPQYFGLKGGLERRLYDIARKFCGHQPSWPVTLRNLHQRVGATSELKRFRLDLAKIIAKDNLPEYTYEIVEPKIERKPGAPKPRTNLDRLKVIVRRRTKTAPELADPAETPAVLATAGALPLPFAKVSETPTNVGFPASGTIRYSRWRQIALDALPRPTPDTDMVAAKFRQSCERKGIALDASGIEKTFAGFCRNWILDRG